MTALMKKLDPGITILLIEHDTDVAFELTVRATVLHFGKVVADGVGDAVKANPPGPGDLPGHRVMLG